MAQEYTFTLPYPPSANRYWRFYRNHPVVSDEARNYKLAAGLVARAAGVEPIKGDVHLRLEVYMPRKAGDLSNRIKILEDALNGVAFTDDQQVTDIHAIKHIEPPKKRGEGRRQGYVVVTVREAA